MQEARCAGEDDDRLREHGSIRAARFCSHSQHDDRDAQEPVVRARRTSALHVFVMVSSAASCDSPSIVTLCEHSASEHLDNTPYAQIRDVARRAQVHVRADTAAHDDTAALRDAKELARTSPPVPARACAAALCRGALAERTRVRELERGAGAQRGADERVLEVERETRAAERERNQMCSEWGRLRVREACKGEGRGRRGRERENIVRREKRGVTRRLCNRISAYMRCV
jgi:hypothetical protein